MQKLNNAEMSVIAPIYNEKENIRRLVHKIDTALKKNFSFYEIILINDGSSDGSFEEIEDMARENPSVKAYHFTKNNGQTAALDAGFRICTGDLVVSMDGDLQTDPEDIYLLLPHLEQFDMVNGMRSSREDGLKKKIQSIIGNNVRNFITGDDIKDTGCPLKLFKKEVVKQFHLYDGMHRFLPTLAKYNGYRVIEVPVRHFDREFGTSKYNMFNRMFKGLRDAFVVRWMKQRMLRYEFKDK